jgi:hypothetical protein
VFELLSKLNVGFHFFAHVACVRIKHICYGRSYLLWLRLCVALEA